MLEFKMHPGEHVILSLRKHPLILVGKLIPFIILDYLPYLLPKLGGYLDAIGGNPAFSYVSLFSFGSPWFDFAVGVYWLFVWMGAFSVFTNHFLDQWVVTNERIIDIDQKDFWSREVSSLFLERVQNVETDVQGFFHTLFGFGTLTVESAGAEIGKVRMRGLPSPGHVRDVILQEVAKRQAGSAKRE